MDLGTAKCQDFGFGQSGDGDSVPNWDNLPPTLKNSPNLRFYVDAVRAGWSVRQLEKQAFKLFGEKIGRHVFHNLQQLVPKNEKLDETFRMELLKNIEAMIDVLQEMPDLIEVQKKRLTDAIRFERSLGKGKDAGVIPLKSTTEELTTLWSMLKDYGNIQINLGLIEKRRQVLGITAGDGVGILDIEAEIMELRRTMTDEQYVRLVKLNQESTGVILLHFLMPNEGVTIEEEAVIAIS